jgi:general secretion pathway protein H
MPTLAAGNKCHSRCARGFTLLELLVVVAIVALASAGAALALRDSAHAGLETQAHRLVALLESGRAQSRASGMAVRWNTTAKGFVLDGKEQMWQIPGIQAHTEQPVLLGPEPIIAHQSVTLWLTEHPERRLLVATDGVRPFEVSDAPR